MLNDAVLSGLINLFALLGAKSDIALSAASDLLEDYLGRHFGLRDKKSYMDLYGDLRALYDEDATMDKDLIAANICTQLKKNVSSSDLSLILLRLMEFCNVSEESFGKCDTLFRGIAQNLGVSQRTYADFTDFICGNVTERVLNQSFDGYDGYFRTLWLANDNKLIFSYFGNDEVLLNDVLTFPGVFQVWHESGVLKNHKGAPLYYSSVHNAYESNSSQRIEFSATDVNFRFPGSNNGLHDFTTVLRSGELVAIMGGSGAGKTTLLSILNGSIKPQEGKIEINGLPLEDPAAKELVGFVPQDDLLIDELTVYQNLYYTARLCFDGMSAAELDLRVMTVLKDLGLEATKDLVVGSPLKKIISGGQRKRLNIALELIREPAVIFLDEPTSGLSSSDTDNVMGLLKQLTYKGKLVVVNIHQPSSDVYKLFDRLFVLDLGGYPVFDGNPIDAITYFKTAANYADCQTSTCPTCGNVNPETVLNIINEKALDSSGLLSGYRKVSPAQWHEMYLERRQNASRGNYDSIPDSGQKRPGAFRQFCIFLKRNIAAKFTDLQYVLITLLEAPVLALVCGLLTRYAPAQGYSVMDNKNFVSYIFMAIIVAVFLGMSGSAEAIFKDRTLLKREKFLSLSYPAYIMSKIVYAAGVSLLQTALFILVGNLLMGLHGMFMLWWAVLFISALLSSLIGLILSQSLGSIVSIYITIPILLIPQILLCGLVVSFSDLNGSTSDDSVPLIGDVIPSRWAFEALAVGTYCYNDYERDYFEIDKERMSTLFYGESFIPELESRAARISFHIDNGRDTDPEDVAVLQNELPTLAKYTPIEPYGGDYADMESVKSYLKDARMALRRISNAATLQKDRWMQEDIAYYGKEEMLERKKANCNKYLEDCVTGADAKNVLEVVDGHIVPYGARIFLTPSPRNGRAPFYSSEKVLGNLHIPTLWFNCAVMVLMCLILGIALIVNIPEKFNKKY